VVAEVVGEESAEQKFAREAGERIMQAIALSQFAAELRAAGAAAGLHSATSPATGARGKKLPQFDQLTRVRGGVDINDARKVRSRLKNR